MAAIANTPPRSTHLRVEARKSFALSIWIKDRRNNGVDLTGCTLQIVAKASPYTTSDDSTNILAADASANIQLPKLGFGRFNIQASTLDVDAGEYEYAIVLTTSEGYSSIIVKGILEVEENVAYAGVESTYGTVSTTETLNVLIDSGTSISVFVGGQLPPGMNYVSDEIAETLADFDADAIALVPAGGTPGYVLTKISGSDYDMEWRPEGNGTFGLDATSITAGYMPVAQGDDTWVWQAAGIDATGVTAGYAPVANGDDTWSWASVTVPDPDWSATIGNPGYIENKPTLGTASAEDVDFFTPASELLTERDDVHIVTTIPASGTDGHLYLYYTP